MSKQATILFVLSMLVALTLPTYAVLDWVEWEFQLDDPEEFCRSGCVRDIFSKYCEDMGCTTQQPGPEIISRLCHAKCIVAIGGKEMNRCLRETFPKMHNATGFQDVLLSDASFYCNGTVKVEVPIKSFIH